MITLKCKMCGGALEVSENTSVAECEYCGTRQTIPNLDDERKAALFDRANYCRTKNEFDKASLIYESIVNEFPNEAEAYWGLCLCRYGIEYVLDPKSEKRVPTCHRTQFKSILEDADYISAIKNSNAVAKDVYRSEAEYIDQVQKDILSISSKEEPFDIFICYKETDENGNRTTDSVIAQDIYSALTDNGYKVFFSRITLEDKLGSAYEPYIFAALNSAKVMLVVGTKLEYINAVWVKNEWSRYLALIEQGEKKVIIPCYKEIDAYELPSEFLALQAQDMSKVGAMQDLVRGIGKIIGKRVKSEITKNEGAEKSISNEIALPDGGLYVGEVLAGKPHGKGKCIYENGDTYEGEWAFGKWNGQGKQTWNIGYFEGEFKDGKRNGSGKITWTKDGRRGYQGNKIWSSGDYCEGIWKDGQRNGYGKYVLNTGECYYEGEFENSIPLNGNGRWDYDNDDYFVGEFRDGMPWTGTGKWTYDNGVYEGEWKAGEFDGKGEVIFNDNGSYEGQFKNGEYDGKGKRIWGDTCYYDGDWKDGNRHGEGIMHWDDGSTWEGTWCNNNAENGFGRMFWNPNNDPFDGEIKNGMRWNGKGRCTYDDGVYEGDWKEGKRTGQGTYTWNNGDVYEGDFKEGKMTGKGKIVWCRKNNSTFPSGYENDYYEGEFDDGRLHGYGELNEFGRRILIFSNNVFFKECHSVGEWRNGKLWDGTISGQTEDGHSKTKVKKGQQSPCYVATCVYGSYDCPPVWTLRRYRDYKLNETLYGRAFIKTYYTISPTIVSKFGKQKWFKKLCKSVLDKFIAKLKAEGFDDSPYTDKY